MPGGIPAALVLAAAAAAEDVLVFVADGALPDDGAEL